MTLCIQVTSVFILSTLGLFDFSVVQVPNANQYRLAETGTSQKHLSKSILLFKYIISKLYGCKTTVFDKCFDFTGRFEAVRFQPIIPDPNADEYLPFYMYREENGVQKYMKVGDSSNDYRLTVTTVSYCAYCTCIHHD